MKKMMKILRLIYEILDIMTTSVMMEATDRGKCIEKVNQISELLHTDEE